LDPNRKVEIKTNVFPYSAPFHSIFMRVKLLGRLYGINLRCCWEHLGELEGNPIWNHIGNQEKIKNPFPPHPPPKENNCTPHQCMLSLLIGCRNFDFQSRLSPFLAWAQTRCGSRIKTGRSLISRFSKSQEVIKKM
jgi:hypothetical protein